MIICPRDFGFEAPPEGESESGSEALKSIVLRFGGRELSWSPRTSSLSRLTAAGLGAKTCEDVPADDDATSLPESPPAFGGGGGGGGVGGCLKEALGASFGNALAFGGIGARHYVGGGASPFEYTAVDRLLATICGIFAAVARVSPTTLTCSGI